MRQTCSQRCQQALFFTSPVVTKSSATDLFWACSPPKIEPPVHPSWALATCACDTFTTGLWFALLPDTSFTHTSLPHPPPVCTPPTLIPICPFPSPPSRPSSSAPSPPHPHLPLPFPSPPSRPSSLPSVPPPSAAPSIGRLPTLPRPLQLPVPVTVETVGIVTEIVEFVTLVLGFGARRRGYAGTVTVPPVTSLADLGGFVCVCVCVCVCCV